MGRQVLGDGGEARDVGEQDSGLGGLACKDALALAAQDRRGDAFVDVAAEGLADLLALAQALDHVVELARERADLVVGRHGNALAEVAFGYLAHGACQDADWLQQRAGDEVGRDRHAHQRHGHDVGDLDLEPIALVGEEVDDNGGERRDRDHRQGDTSLAL